MVLAKHPWAPAADDELLWFRPGSIFPSRPTPLEFTLDVYALASGLSHSLVSLNFPLYQIRARLVDGELYLGSVPSGLWALDPDAKTTLMQDASLRYTRNLRAPWERDVRREVESYNSLMKGLASSAAESDAELAEQFRRLRRERDKQWHAFLRAVVGPLAMLHRRLEQLAPDSPDRETVAKTAADGGAVLEEGLALVREEGSALATEMVEKVARRLVEKGALASNQEITWLEWEEIREALVSPGDWAQRASARKAAAQGTRPSEPPATFGPPLAPSARHMDLVPEVLALLAE